MSRASSNVEWMLLTRGKTSEERLVKLMPADKSQSPDERLQQEFNRWADDGEGAKMERHHLDITEKTMRRMDLRPGERILDLGCGSGWATRMLARMVGEEPHGSGKVVGIDISDEMIRQARAASKEFDNVMFVVGSAAQIPDDTPTPDNYRTTSFHSLDDLRAFKRVGALLLMASKPDVRNPAPAHAIY